ncbi:SDR family NAD(P)-dependent oxidoreductase [Pyxidicoccus trucidator]|uniref:SDR family NAD(P)-dependent oxidoreductase n=1 Tax=Pyxidicoccus trucidator TaxID=2709662 RepID=UPI0023DDC3CF|nr:SDR family NAD(P)-dependent oxidoreductase [Pyxidicoccus trucidator]
MESPARMGRHAEELLRRDSRVRDVWVAGEGSEAVAWVVPRRAVRSEDLVALLRERLGTAAPAVALVDALPRRDSGAVDIEALARLDAPVPSRLQHLEDSLRQAGAEAVALVGPRREEETFEPLDALLPESLLPRGTGADAPAPSEPAVATTVQVSGGPSLIDSGPRQRPAGAPETLVELLRQAVEQSPERVITFLDVEGRRETLTFAGLWDAALRMWGGLEARGVRAGDRVVLAVERPGDYVRGFWACTLGGVVPVPLALPSSLDRAHPGIARLLSVAERLGSPPVITDARAAGPLEAMGLKTLAPSALEGVSPGRPASVEPEAPAILSFTSGSTGRPKGVVLTHANLMAMGEGMVAGGWYLPEDVGVSWMPLDHVAGTAYPHLLALRTRTPHVLVARDYVLADVTRWLDLLTEFGGTMSWAPNFAFGLVADRLENGVRRAWELSRVRVLACGGEPVLPATMERFVRPLRAFGLREDAVCPGWGMAETSSYFTVTRGVRAHPTEGAAELGPPPRGAALRVVDDADAVVPEGTVGHLQVRGAQVLAGYLDDPELNARSFAEGGWLRTGDLAVFRGDQLCIAGRQKEVLILHGNNVYPQDIEAVVEEVPGVLPSYTVACPTRGAGAQTDELVVLFVPTPDAPPLAELLRSIRERVGRGLGLQAAYIVPLERHQVPRTELGKRGRTELRRRFDAGELATERRRAERVLGGPATLPRCLAVARWVPRALPEVSGGGARGPVVVVAEEGVVAALRALAAGREVVGVEPGDAGALGATLESLWARGSRCEDVVVASGSLGRVSLSAAVAPVLQTVQALAPWAATAPVRLLAVLPEAGEGSAFASGPTSIEGGVGHLMVPGLAWAATAEVPGLEARVVWTPSGAESSARCVAEELASMDAAREVAWRDGQRWERTFSPWMPPALAEPRQLMRGGLYLVTGALGGLGREWARYLRRALGARLLLVGRRPRGPEAEELEREVREALYAQVDVTDAAALREAVRRAEDHFNQPCDGAFHFAGMLVPTALADETPVGLARGAGAHALGALAVVDALRERPRAVLVFAASLMGTLGAGRHAGYCAATGFLERLAERLVQEGRRAVAVSLSQVRDTGLARSLGAAPPGYRVLEPAQALAALALGAEHGPAHLLAGVEASAWPWRQAGLGEGRPLEAAHVFHVAAEVSTHPVNAVLHSLSGLPRREDGAVDREALAARISGAGDDAPAGPFEALVMETFHEVLGAGGVGAGSDFFTLGGSSLQATRVVARINERTGLRLREATLFEHPTASALAAHVRQVVDLAQVDVSVLTDAQVDLLLRVLRPD